MYPSSRPMIMGIVNVTPDSFSDGGETFATRPAIERALRLIDDGADMIDIGGESTRPPGKDYGNGARSVDADEEMRRVLPVIEAIHAERPDAVISIDTMKPEVAYHAVRAGAGIINDVSAGHYDERIWKVAADENVPYVLMHGYDPASIVSADSVFYNDVVQEVYGFLDQRIRYLRRAGIEHVIADVGIGFAKGAADNIRLIQGHSCFSDLGVPLLIGLSRKSFIGRILRGAPPKERLFGTLAALAIAVSNGANIIRVHDVQAVREFFDVYNVLRHRPADERSLYLGIDDDNVPHSHYREGLPST